MNVLFSILFFACLVTLFLGLAKPTLYKKKNGQPVTRKEIATVCGVLMVIFLILAGATSKSGSQSSTAAHPSPPTAIAHATKTPVPTIPFALKRIGTCKAPSGAEYTISYCSVMQDNATPPGTESSILAIVSPTLDTSKEKLQAIATEISKDCGKDCSIRLFDNAAAADEAYKEEVMSRSEFKQYINDDNNLAASDLVTKHEVEDLDAPDSFTYLYIPVTPTTTPTPTETPIPNDANGFPEDAERITVADLAKIPSSYQGKKITFTCEVVSFPKDENGNAAGVNCSDPNDYASIVQVEMGAFDQTVKVNAHDTVVVYGMGQGAAQGTNAFGGNVTEAVVLELHMKDLTTGWSE